MVHAMPIQDRLPGRDRTPVDAFLGLADCGGRRRDRTASTAPVSPSEEWKGGQACGGWGGT